MISSLRIRGSIAGVLVIAVLAWMIVRGGPKSPILAQAPERNGDRVTPLPAGEVDLNPNVVRQGFPAGKADPNDVTKSDTAWEIEWELTHPTNRPFYPPGSVLRIKSAKFMWKDRTGKPQWITVARMLELAEMYVPYDDGWTAFLDIHDMPFHITAARPEFLGPNCVLPGEILASSNTAWSGTVHKEVHDDGIRWMSAETSYRNQIADRARRGEKMLLWSCYYGGNYRYLIEYAFSDDGMISCRVGPTGRNLFNRRNDKGDTHLHIGCWRFDPDLGDPTSSSAQTAGIAPLSPRGRGGRGEGEALGQAAPSPPTPLPRTGDGRGGPRDNEILLVRRVLDETTERFAQVAKPFAKDYRNQACEGSARWVPEEFTSVRIESKVRKNSHGRPVAFEMVPHRFGALRHLQNEGGARAANMDFINYDFWVTRAESGFTHYVDVPRYAAERRPLAGHATTIWHCAPVLHAARGEDFSPDDGNTSYGGVALTFWTGFYLKPRELFDGTPLYVPAERMLR